MSEKKIKEIELISDETQDMLGSVPPWIIRWGTTVIFISLLIILGFSMIIKYPDQITSSISILSENPPSEVISKVDGKIQYLFVKDGDIVKEKQHLAVLDNTADYNHVQQLKLKIDSLLNFFSKHDLKLPNLPKYYSLGSFQSTYISFYTQYQELKNFLTLDPTESKISSLNAQFDGYGSDIVNQGAQLENLLKMLVLSHKKYARDSTLFHQKVLTAAEFDLSEQAYLLDKNKIEQIKGNINKAKAERARLQFDILNLREQSLEKVNQYINSVSSSLKTLQSAIIEWERQYLLVSPIDGKIAFNVYWSTNQNVTSGSTVFTVIPSKFNKIIGRIQLPSIGFGKVETGQKVNVMLDNYPYTEFGMVNAVVEDIAIIPESNNGSFFYTVKVGFPDSLRTSYHISLPFSQKLQGTAEIITNKLSVFDRVTQNLKSVIDKSYE